MRHQESIQNLTYVTYIEKKILKEGRNNDTETITKITKIKCKII